MAYRSEGARLSDLADTNGLRMPRPGTRKRVSVEEERLSACNYGRIRDWAHEAAGRASVSVGASRKASGSDAISSIQEDIQIRASPEHKSGGPLEYHEYISRINGGQRTN